VEANSYARYKTEVNSSLLRIKPVTAFKYWNGGEVDSGDARIAVGFLRQPHRLRRRFSARSEADYLAAGIIS